MDILLAVWFQTTFKNVTFELILCHSVPSCILYISGTLENARVLTFQAGEKWLLILLKISRASIF